MANNVSTIHPLLQARLNQIRRSRDAFQGTDSIKRLDKDLLGNQHFSKIDEEYLPRLSGQDQETYDNYKKRAVFFAAMSRTVTALVGAIDRKPPTIKGEEMIQDFAKDVTGTGVSLSEFLCEIEAEIMVSGRVTVCVDRKNAGDNSPYLIWYKSEDTVNWFSTVNADFDEKISRMIFKESYFAPSTENEYAQIRLDQYREYTLDSSGNANVVLWRTKDIEETNGAEVDWIKYETYNLTNRGRPLGFLPCVPIVSDGSTLEVPKPPLLDLVDVNISHYRNSADYEHGMHWTALPTPYFTGLSDRDGEITIGSGSAIILPDPASKAGFLEFSGTGLATIKTAMDHKEGMMSALGARMLAGKMDQSTSAEVARINMSGESAALSNIAKSMSRGITRLLQMVVRWENVKGYKEVQVHLNEDYVDSKLAAADITALMGAYQGGVMSLESLVWNLGQGERLPIGRTIEEEMVLIESDLDREAEEALFYEGENIAFSGKHFSSEAGSAQAEEESHTMPDGTEMDGKKHKE